MHIFDTAMVLNVEKLGLCFLPVISFCSYRIWETEAEEDVTEERALQASVSWQLEPDEEGMVFGVCNGGGEGGVRKRKTPGQVPVCSSVLLNVRLFVRS